MNNIINTSPITEDKLLQELLEIGSVYFDDLECTYTLIMGELDVELGPTARTAALRLHEVVSVS